MRRNRFSLLGVAVLWAATTTWGQTQARPPIPLPADPSAAVIVVDDATQYGYGNCAQNRQPFLTIRADGSVVVVNTCTNSVVGRGVLKPEELQDLLRFAIEDQGFFSFDPAGSYKPLPPERENIRIFLSHAKVTVVTIQTADRQHQTRADLSSMREPSVQFAALERRLTSLAEAIKAGGTERVAEALRDANRYLAQERREWGPLKFDDFRAGWQARAGQPEFSFLRDLDDGTWHEVLVERAAGQQPRVRILTGVRDKPNPAGLVDYLRELTRARTIPEELGR